MVDFHASMEAYNRKYGTDYVTILDFAQDIYDKCHTIFNVGCLLSISPSAVHTYFTRIGVKFLPKGHRGMSNKLAALIMLDTRNKTLDELAHITGLSKSYIKTVLGKHHKVYKKTKSCKWYRRVPGSNGGLSVW